MQTAAHVIWVLQGGQGGGGLLCILHVHVHGKENGGVYSVCAWPESYGRRPSHPYYAATEHVGFSTRQTLLAPSAKRREVFGDGGGSGVLVCCLP